MLRIAPEKDEMEDRIYNDSPIIPHATKYIKSIHILFSDTINTAGRKSLMVLKRSGIPIWLYNDQQSYILQDTTKAKSLEDYTVEPATYEPRWPRVDKDATDKQYRRRAKKAGDTIVTNRMQYGMARWITLLKTPIDQFNTLGRSTQYFIKHGMYREDELRSLKVDLQNIRQEQSWIDKLQPIMKKNNLRSAEDIIDFIINRWKPVVDN
jgi:hypothetical protein